MEVGFFEVCTHCLVHRRIHEIFSRKIRHVLTFHYAVTRNLKWKKNKKFIHILNYLQYIFSHLTLIEITFGLSHSKYKFTFKRILFTRNGLGGHRFSGISIRIQYVQYLALCTADDDALWVDCCLLCCRRRGNTSVSCHSCSCHWCVTHYSGRTEHHLNTHQRSKLKVRV